MTRRGRPNKARHVGRDTGPRKVQVGRSVPIRIWPNVTNPQTRCIECSWVPREGIPTIKFINRACVVHKETRED